MIQPHKQNLRRPTILWMTLQEVAAYLRLSRETLYRLAQQGEIPASKVRQQWRFRRDKVDAWMESLENTRGEGRMR